MGNDLNLRPWNNEDCQTIYDWRVHIDSRRWSMNQQEFSFADHQAWFNRITADPARFCFMLEVDLEPIAQIRFEPAAMPGCYRISVSVAPGRTGNGYGCMILRQACRQPDLLRVASLLVAETMVANVPSQKIFARQGFFKIAEVAREENPYFIWIQPLAMMPTPPLPMQIFAPVSQLDQYEAVLARTGLGQMSGQSAPVKIFFDGATCSDLADGTMVFHLNNAAAGECLLDHVEGLPCNLSLPVTFADSTIAVAQIAAAVKYLTGVEK